MTNRNLQVALLGYGFAGGTFHAPLLGSVDGMTLHVVASSDREKVSRDCHYRPPGFPSRAPITSSRPCNRSRGLRCRLSRHFR